MKRVLTACLLLSLQTAFAQSTPPPPTVITTTTSTASDTPALIAVNENQNGCALKFSDMDSFFIQDSKLFKKMGKIERDSKKHILKQTVTMGSGTEVTIAKGGCSHFAFIITMKPQKVQHALPHHLFRQTLQILERFPVPRDEFKTLAPIKKALTRNNWESIKRDGDHYALPCGDATCTLKTIKDKDGNAEKEIELTYDFAL